MATLTLGPPAAERGRRTRLADLAEAAAVERPPRQARAQRRLSRSCADKSCAPRRRALRRRRHRSADSRAARAWRAADYWPSSPRRISSTKPIKKAAPGPMNGRSPPSAERSRRARRAAPARACARRARTARRKRRRVKNLRARRRRRSSAASLTVAGRGGSPGERNSMFAAHPAARKRERYRRACFVPSASERSLGRGNFAALPRIDRDRGAERSRQSLERGFGDMMAVLPI